MPQALPQAGGFGYAAQARSNKRRQLLAAGVIVAVGLGLGSLLGSMLEQRDQLASYVRTVDAKLTWMSEFKTESGSTILEEIELVRNALSTTMTKIEAVEGKGGDPMKLQDSFDSVLMPALEGLRRNKAFFASTRVSDDIQVLYADDVLLKAVQFAIATERLYHEALSALDEYALYQRFIKPARGGGRRIQAKRAERELEGGGKYAVLEGVWLKEVGKPAEVKLVDSKNRSNNETEWQQMVLPMGATDPVQVPTYEVLELDMGQYAQEQEMAARLLTIDRLATITRNLSKIAAELRWDLLKAELQKWSAKASD